MGPGRNAFQKTPQEENEVCLREGTEIFKKLQEKYPPTNQVNLDIILNTLCCSLICLLLSSVERDNRRIMIQVIHQIITKNI